MRHRTLEPVPKVLKAIRKKVERHLLVVLCILVCVLGFSGGALGQDKVPQTQEEVERGEAPEEKPEPSESPTEAPDEAASEDASASEQLVSRFQVDPESLASSDDVRSLIEKTSSGLEELRADREALESERVVQAARRDTLKEQLEVLPPAVRELVGVTAAGQAVHVAHTNALIAEREARSEKQERVLSLLRAHLDTLHARETEREESGLLEEQRKRQAEEEERQAAEALEQARERERQERDEALRSLLSRQRELAEDLLEVTKAHNERIQKIRQQTRDQLNEFTRGKAKLLEKIEALPASPATSERKEQVDPVFQDLVKSHREARGRYFKSLERAEAASDQVDAARKALAKAEAELAEEREREEHFDGSELWKRRVEVAEGLVRLRKQQLEAAREVEEAYAERVSEYRKHVDFFATAVRELLPRISGEQHDEYFTIFSDENWADALGALRRNLMEIYANAEQRFEQLIGLSDNLLSFTVWGWIGGFLWRLLLVMLVIRLVFPALPNLIRRVTEMLFRRRFFRMRPTLTIKLAEVLGAVARPGLLYFVIIFVGKYVAATFEELEVLLWVIDAIFLYWLSLEFLSTLILPRWHRREQGKTATEQFENLDIEQAQATSDIIGMSLLRAQKLMRSARVILIFWILAAYIPDFVMKVTGPTVIWHLVDQGATWGFIFILYWVISTWRDDIAALFARLARDRMEKAVQFVNENKNRPWGVLVIGVASIFVIAMETARVARKYILNTEWFRRASNFAFRKKIELQQRDREESSVRDASPAELPQDYISHFEDQPAQQEEYRIDRSEYVATVLDHLRDWQTHRRQGSVAILGETGIGRTTVLRQLPDAFADLEDPPEVIHHVVESKYHQAPDVLEFLADLFGIDAKIDRSQILIDKLRELPTRVIILDDCHHFFLRRINGFDGLESLLDIVNLTDESHFWVLSFNGFAWSYVNRVEERSHYFGEVVRLPAWNESEIQELIERRNNAAGYSVSFSDLVVATDRAEEPDYFYEVVKSARGYFRYLSQFSGGNPRVAFVYWLRSLRYDPGTETLSVSLFRRPSTKELLGMKDDYWFVLTAITQHGELDAAEVASIINSEEGFCALAMNYFEEKGIIEIDPATRRGRLTPLYFRQVLNQLSNSNFLYG